MSYDKVSKNFSNEKEAREENQRLSKMTKENTCQFEEELETKINTGKNAH